MRDGLSAEGTTLDRVGLALVATGVLSLVSARASVEESVAATRGLTLGFAALLALSLLASARVPPAWSARLALLLTAGTYVWSATLDGVAEAGALALAGALLIAYRFAEPAYRIFLVAGFALWTPALALVARAVPVHPSGLVVASAVASFALLVVAVFVGRGTPEARLRRVALGLVAIAVVSTVFERHSIVASVRVAPDDAMALVAVVVLAVLAVVRLRSGLVDALALGVALAAYALVALALILGKGYHVDAVASSHYAAELLLAGKDPYVAFRMDDALARFGLPAGLATHLEDGSVLQAHVYPAGGFLLAAPFVALGLRDIRWVYLAEVLLLTLLVAARWRLPWRALVAALVVGNVVLTRQYVLAGVDPTWALGVALAWLFLERRLLSPLALGLACASRQPAWFVVPFYLLLVWRSAGIREAARRGVLAALAFAVPNLPFLIDAPGAWASSVFAPLVLPLEPYGVGIVQLGIVGPLPLLPRAAYAALSAVALAGLLALLWWRRRDVPSGALTFPLAALFAAWRSLQNYFVFLPVFAILPRGDARERDEPT